MSSDSVRPLRDSVRPIVESAETSEAAVAEVTAQEIQRWGDYRYDVSVTSEPSRNLTTGVSLMYTAVAKPAADMSDLSAFLHARLDHEAPASASGERGPSSVVAEFAAIRELVKIQSRRFGDPYGEIKASNDVA